MHIVLLSSHEELLQRKLREAERVGGIIEAIMLYDMQQDHMHDFQTYINMLPLGADLSTIRVFDHDGFLHYAVGDTAIGRHFDRTAEPACAACHLNEGVPKRNRNLYHKPDGTYIFQADFPLQNAPECQICHISGRAKLGNILTELTFSPIEQRIINRRTVMIYIGALVMISAIFIIWALVQYQVVKPVRELVRVIEASKQGELSGRVQPSRDDEIGFLAASFNEMMDSLVQLRDNLEDTVKTRTAELESSRIQLSLRENLAALGRLAAGVAHELGNPLTGISSIVQLVKRRKKEDPFVVEQLDLVQAEIERLARLSRQMVDLARPASANRNVFDISVSIQRAHQIAHLDRKLKKRVVKLPPVDQMILVQANEDAIIQILMNLFFNAADATDDNGIITVDLKNGTNGFAELRVTDNGSGIPEEMLHHIFNPFFTAKREGEGVGLGLSVSHSLARSFRGELILESSNANGTTFLLKVPLSRAVTDG